MQGRERKAQNMGTMATIEPGMTCPRYDKQGLV